MGDVLTTIALIALKKHAINKCFAPMAPNWRSEGGFGKSVKAGIDNCEIERGDCVGLVRIGMSKRGGSGTEHIESRVARWPISEVLIEILEN